MQPKKITVYPDPRALAVLGSSATVLNQALEVWANQLARATEANSKAIVGAEWCLIADVCNGTLWEPAVDNPAVLLAAEVSDGHSLDGTGYKWLGPEGVELAGSLERVGAGKPTPAMREVDKQVASLVKRLATMDAPHAWAVIHAVQWFWDQKDLDHRQPWWTLAFRRRALEREVSAKERR